jgi:hypothetical protein
MHAVSPSCGNLTEGNERHFLRTLTSATKVIRLLEALIQHTPEAHIMEFTRLHVREFNSPNGLRVDHQSTRH